jgi:quercetin dioxygenase-like cupin family protein
MRRILAVAAALGALLAPAAAQDAPKADPKHYRVEFENDQVRVLRITYGPHEKSVMHEHPAGVAVFLTDAQVRFHLPDGKAVDATVKAGSTRWETPATHQPENTGDKPMEAILVELKPRPAAAK